MGLAAVGGHIAPDLLLLTAGTHVSVSPVSPATLQVSTHRTSVSGVAEPQEPVYIIIHRYEDDATPPRSSAPLLPLRVQVLFCVYHALLN